MKTNLKTNSDVGNVKDQGADLTLPLKEIITEYNVIGIKLNLMADDVPETKIEQLEHIENETQLLDRQATLLESAFSRPVESLDDAKAVLTLWHHEVVQGQSEDSLSAADALVNSVYGFLKED